MFTFRQMQDMVLEDINYANDSAMRERVKHWLNMTYFELFDALLPEITNEARVLTLKRGMLPTDPILSRPQKVWDATSSRTLPPYMGKVNSLGISEDNLRWTQLKYLPPDQFFEESKGWATSIPKSTPKYFTVHYSISEEERESYAFSQKIVSSDSTDRTQYISVLAYSNQFYPGFALTTVTVRLNGITPVVMASNYTVVGMSKDRPTKGNVELYRDALGAIPKRTIVRLAPEEMMAVRLQIFEFPRADKDYFCRVNYRPRPVTMESDTDTAYKLPNTWYSTLVNGAKAKSFFLVADKRYEPTIGEFILTKQDLVSKLRINESADEGFTWD